MGILPLEFKNGDTRESYATDGTETFDVKGEITHCSEMTLIIHRTNGERNWSPGDLSSGYRRRSLRLRCRWCIATVCPGLPGWQRFGERE